MRLDTTLLSAKNTVGPLNRIMQGETIPCASTVMFKNGNSFSPPA